jgi:hypothetical protein
MFIQELTLPEVYDIWPTSFWQTNVGYAILGMLGVSALFLSGWLIKRYFARRASPKKRMIWRLQKLLRQHPGTIEDCERIYSELTALLKEYMQLIYTDIPRGITDLELLEGIQAKHHAIPMYAGIATLMAHAQEVKFAHAPVDQKKVKDDIMYAISLISADHKIYV